MAADHPALLAAAVKAACQAKAPRRTIQAVASAVAAVLARPVASATPCSVHLEPARQPRRSNPDLDADDGASTEALTQALRAARASQRQLRKTKRKAARARDAAAGKQEQQPEWTEKVDEEQPVLTAMEDQDDQNNGHDDNDSITTFDSAPSRHTEDYHGSGLNAGVIPSIMKVSGEVHPSSPTIITAVPIQSAQQTNSHASASSSSLPRTMRPPAIPNKVLKNQDKKQTVGKKKSNIPART